MWNIFKNKKNINEAQELQKDYIIELGYIVQHVEEYVSKIINDSHYSYKEKNGADIIEGTYLIENISLDKLIKLYSKTLDINKKIYMPKLNDGEYCFRHKNYLYKYTIDYLATFVDGDYKRFIELKIEKGIKILD